MAEVNTDAEQSIAEAHTEQDLDAKLRRATEANHALAAKRRAAGESKSTGSIVERVLGMAPPAERSVIARIRPEDGDPIPAATVPDAVIRELVPARFSATTLDSYTPATSGQSLALRAVRAWIDRARGGDGVMLALIGPTGTGKSHLLYSAANALLGTEPRYPVGCYARPWYKLANDLRYGGVSPFAPTTSSEPAELRALLWRQRIVLLDEVRPTAGTAFDDTELAMFACHAYDAKISVLITSNVSPLEDVMGPPAASRFAKVIVDGADYRAQRPKAAS